MAVAVSALRDIHAKPSTLSLLNPLTLLALLWQHGSLLWQFAWRTFSGRYKGSMLGILWSILNPLLLLAVYSFTFGLVFKARWGLDPSEGYLEYTLAMFCGLAVFSLFSETLTRAPSVIVDNVNYVKRVIFPLEILPVASVLSALITSIVSLLILVVALLLIKHSVPLTIFWLPVVIIPLFLICIGCSWFISALGVFVRDIQQSVALIVQVLFFVTPIFFPITSVPEKFRFVLQLNPLAAIVENARRVALFGESIEWRSWGYTTLFALIFCQLAFLWFVRCKRAFSDVI